MLEKKITYICAQPAELYFAWQVEVLINNFIDMDIDLSQVHIVCSIKDEIPNDWLLLKENYNANFFFYKDTRKSVNYVSTIRPHILKKHFKENSYLEDCAIFYHDCDIVFTHSPNEWLKKDLIDDEVCYGSNTNAYISYEYIKSKGDDILQKMCEIIDIPIDVIKLNKVNGIGAQYLLKNINSDFWERVESDSEKLYTEIMILNNQKVKEDRYTVPPDITRIPYNPLQIWCADMWALLWNLWKLNKKTKVLNEFNFSWPIESVNYWNERNIFHNSGVVTKSTEIFYKQSFTNKTPYKWVLPKPNKEICSWNYYKFIKQVGKKSVLI